MKPDWIKFRYMNIKALDVFSNLITDSLAFDKCKLDASMISVMGDVKKLQIISCDMSGELQLPVSLEELHLIYTLEDVEELKAINLGDIKELTISGDIVSTPEGKEYINELKKTIKIKTVGPTL